MPAKQGAKKVAKKVAKCEVEKVGSPTYNGPPVSFDLVWHGDKWHFVVEPWKQHDIDMRGRVRDNTPLFVVKSMNDENVFAPMGFAMLKTTMGVYIIREGPHDSRPANFGWAVQAIAHIWVCHTMPDHPVVMSYYRNIVTLNEYNPFRSAMKEHFAVFGGRGQWWHVQNVRELNVARLTTVKKRKKTWA